MREKEFFKRATAWALILLLALPFTAIAQQATNTAAAQNSGQVFRPEELDQMFAPIALYPDALLAQVLTASTYPLQVVSAARFARDNPNLKGQALIDAAKDKDWEPSVKAMLEFPDVLAMMDKELDWTTKLGDAFLAQQRDCMDSVQRLRQKAYAQGNLKTTNEQMVKAEPDTQVIIIEPASPDVVYVPVYDPAIVYGVWWYPAYPPYYFYPTGYAGGAFLAGIAVGFAWGAWGAWGCDWYHHDVNININHYNNFTHNNYVRPEPYRLDSHGRSNRTWEHNPQYRKGAAYRDSSTAQRYGAQQFPASTARTGASDFRGYDRAETRPSTGSLQTREAQGVTRPSTSTGYVKPHVSGQHGVRISTPTAIIGTGGRGEGMPSAREYSRSRGGYNALSGAGNGANERAASYRGQSSSQSARSQGSFGGGGGHGGGGRSGGRGGGRR